MHREGGTPIVGTTNSSTSYHALLGAPDAMNNNGVISSIPTTSPSGYSGYPIPTTQTSGSSATNPYKNIPCGFLGLSQFVNRSNCPVDGDWQTWPLPSLHPHEVRRRRIEQRRSCRSLSS